ncbi:MAG TPA: aminotransferase class III-fold pyridoxal phosphate-dependent enzyme [Actinomycetota bacterium]|nr:aminotransferase class III-fold pyridoxal phosphate-dependent enzyme [Actinomycetota bacterium]
MEGPRPRGGGAAASERSGRGRPDPLASPPPAFPAELAAAVARRTFGLEGALSPLVSERDQNFRLETPRGERFLFKISNPADDRAVVEMQTAALRHIERVDPSLPVMRVVPTSEGAPWAEVTGPDGRTYPVRAFTFLPGRHVRAGELTPGAIRGIGEVAARLGRALRGFFHPAAGYEILWDVKHAPRLRGLLGHLGDAGRRAQAARVLDRFEERVSPAFPALRAQVIHGDLTLDNALFDDDLRVTGIVDFGDMSHTALVCDLAVAVADVLQGRPDATAAAEALIRGYARVTPLEDPEAELLVDLVAARLVTAVVITAWRVKLYPENEGYISSWDAGARAFLDLLEAEGLDAVGRRWAHAARGLPYRPAASDALLARRRRHLPRSPLFHDRPVHLVRGEGVWLFDPEGRRYLDCYNNVPVVGHGHPGVARAVAEQQRLLNTHSRYLHEALVELAERLAATLPEGLDAAFVVNSGSEANDLAWRLAAAATGRGGAIVSAFAYHGLTSATHALSPEEWAEGERPAHVARVPGPDGYRGPYRREEEGWADRYAAHVEEAVEELAGRGHGLAAMYVDPAFTAEGILLPPPEYLRGVERRVREAGGLLVADEVQAGHGRFGTHLWSFQASGVRPDVVVMGKPMGNGIPVAALVCRRELLEAFPGETELFSTFGGNPVAAAAALAVLDAIEEEDILARVRRVGAHLRAGLEELGRRHEAVGDVRAAGLLAGVELVRDRGSREPAPELARAVREAMRERGVLLGVTGPGGNVLKIRPPLVFGAEHADLLLEVLDAALADAALAVARSPGPGPRA